MKILLIIAAIFIVVTNFTYSQWTQQYTNYSGVSYYSIFMIDESNGILVGANSSDEGIIYLTTNGGNDWSNVRESGPELYSVWFPAPNIGIAVGASGKILKTTDGGSTWNARTSGTTRYLWSVFFSDANTGWVAGGHFTFGNILLKTTDQGETWSEKTCSVSDGLFRDIHFINNQVGYAVGYKNDGSIIVKTTDGGENWQTLNSGVSDCSLYSVYFLNENLGWVAGSRDSYPNDPKVVLLKTTDGGNNWNSTVGYKLGSINSLRMCDANIGWAVGLGDHFGNQYGLNYKTTDSRNSWMHLTCLNDITMNCIFFLNPTTGWGNSLASVYKYDGGTDVNEISSFPHQYSLSQNYPNPFNSLTIIKYQIPELSFVTLKVYDVLGSEVVTLVNEKKSVGSYEVEFNATELPSGVYLFRLQAGTYVETKKMVLMK